MKSMGKLRASYDPSKTYQLCKNCKFYVKSSLFPETDASLGFCSKFSEINLVTGEISYQYASIARKFECDGDHYEKKDK
jgi:hypothetical protein